MGNSQTKQAGVVLVADDEHHIRAVVAAKLRGAGLEVLEARDGLEALALAEERGPDVVVTDLQMPGMSGEELVAALAARPATAKTPVIMLTARGFLVERDRPQLANIKGMMSKPFSARDLLARVQAILAGEAVNDSPTGQAVRGASERAA